MADFTNLYFENPTQLNLTFSSGNYPETIEQGSIINTNGWKGLNISGQFNGAITFNGNNYSAITFKVDSPIYDAEVNFPQIDNMYLTAPVYAGNTGMFANCTNLNKPIYLGNYRVNSMNNCFRNCNSLNSIVTYNNTAYASYDNAFFNCRKLNQPMNVYDGICSNMFHNCVLLNSPIDFVGSNGGNYSGIFQNCFMLNADINMPSTIDSAYVLDFRYAFYNCTRFNGHIDLPSVTAVDVSASHMFNNCLYFNQPVTWNVTARSCSIDYMFINCVTLNQPITIDFDVSTPTNDYSYVIDARGLLSKCTAFNSPVTINAACRGLNARLSYLASACVSFNSTISLNITADYIVLNNMLSGSNFNSDIDLNGCIANNIFVLNMLDYTPFDKDLYLPDSASGAPLNKGSNTIDAISTYTHTISMPHHHETHYNNSVVPDYGYDSGISPKASTVGATVEYRDGASSGTVIPYYHVSNSRIAGYTWDTYFQYFNHERYYR